MTGSTLQDRQDKGVPAAPSVSIPNAWSLTYDNIREIYEAGRTRGTNEATSFEWGSSPTGKWHDDLAEALYDIVNEGQRYGEPGFHDWDAVEGWVVTQEARWQADLEQAIEARRAATVKQDAVHESAVPEGCAQEPPALNPKPEDGEAR